MPDCYRTKLMFGGAISRTDFASILAALDRDGLFDYQRNEVRDLANDGEIVEITEDQRPWGEFDQTEGCLMRLGIAFEKNVEAKYGYDAQVVVFDGRERRVGCASTDLEPVVTARELRGAHDAGTVAELLARLEALNIDILPVVLDGPPAGDDAAASEAA